MGDIEFDINMKDVRRVVYGMPETMKMVRDSAEDIHSRATRMSAGFTSGIRHDPVTGERQGGTPAEYGMKAELRKRNGPYAVPVGLVFTANYAAQKDNHKNNTLLKSMG